MSSAYSISVPKPLLQQGEIVGALFAALCVPLAILEERYLVNVSPAGFVLPIILLSAAAGAVAASIVSPLPDYPPGAIPRTGIRAGVVCAMLGSALTVLVYSLCGVPKSLLAANLPSGSSLDFQPFGALLLGLLSFPPAVVFGTAGALLIALWRGLPGISDGRSRSPVKSVREHSILFKSVLAVSVLLYLQALIPLFQTKAKPAPVPVASPEPRILPWKYEKPENFAEADASRLMVVARRRIDNADSASPMSLTSDGRLLAYCASGNTIEAVDLDHFRSVSECRINGTAKTLAWSPNSGRIFCVLQSDALALGVFDLAENSFIPLPLPKGSEVPSGPAIWWQDQEILFPEARKTLDLDTLKVSPLESSAKWKSLSEEEQNKILHPALLDVFSHPKLWKLGFDERIRGYVPSDDSHIRWQRESELQFVWADKRFSNGCFLDGIDAQLGDKFIFSADDTKLIRGRASGLDVFYLGTKSASALTFMLSMPVAPPPSAIDDIAKKSLHVFVCQPIINPLNGKTVGPNRERVKALARISNWEGTKASLWIEEEYEPVSPGDVASGMHTWTKANIYAAGDLGNNCWAPVEQLSSENALPSQADAPIVSQQGTLKVNYRDGVGTVVRFDPSTCDEPSPSQPAVKAQVAEPGASDFQRIIDFISEHHAKSSRNDVNGLVGDYGDHVDHFSNGVVDREFIRKDELAYHSPGIQIAEVVQGDVEVHSIGVGKYIATYRLEFRRKRPDGRWMSGHSAVDLRIVDTPEGPRIYYQRAEVLDRQQGQD